MGGNADRPKDAGGPASRGSRDKPRRGARGKAGLPALRSDIDAIDGELLALLARRRRLSLAVVRAKDSSGSAMRDSKREEELLGRLIQAGRRRGLDAHLVTSVFHEIIDDSLRLQQEVLQRLANPEEGEAQILRVAFQGIEGAYSHLAGRQFFAERAGDLAFLGCPTFAAAIEAVENGRADYAMLPIENTTSGGISEVYDLLLHTRLAIVGEIKYRVEHCLVAATDSAPAGIRRIFSHPQAVAQCSNFLASIPGCKVEVYTDTAESVARVKVDGDPTQAAIASEEAAKMFGLAVIRREIANQRENFTRFLVAARTPRNVDPRIPCKTSLVMATAQKPGALVEALLVFRANGINLTKLESRPILGNPWEEMFYLDFEGNLAEERARKALDELTRIARFLKVLGSYPSQDLPPTEPAVELLSRLPSARRASRGKTVDPAQRSACSGAPAISSDRVARGYRLASREHKRDDTVIEVRGVAIGAGFVVIAGPCAVESREEITSCARAVREHGGRILRGGCFKPRTSPYSFQGLGFDGLELLAEAGRAFGLPVITEVLSPADVEAVARLADILQVGARNMQNFPLLREVGRVPRPVMLKRGMMASLDELLQAAEYILAQGNQQVILCERGIRTFETATRNTLDLSAIPILRSRTHLPVLVDPSHAAGERALVPPLARGAKAVGAQGIMVEIHPDPEKALSDGPQALTFGGFADLMSELLA
jgi:chorismate mutase / prephenate dehydratase